MKKIIYILVLLALGHLQTWAQTDPGTDNLAHQWTFDDGTANDAVATNPVNGTLTGGATIVNKALKLSAQGQYLSLSGTALALKSYTAISQEIWYTPVSGANTGYTMLSYFGITTGTAGYNYLSTSTARGDNKSRTAITNSSYGSEISANGTEYDDGLLHHMVAIVRADSIILYIDGKQAARTLNTIPLSAIGNTLAYLGKGGYTSDPTWIGSISKYSIYNKSLSPAEIKFLYQQGAEQTPILSSPTAYLSFDDLYTSETINVSGINLTDAITITAPEGITATPSSLDATANNASVTITYDGTTTVNGNVTLTSGTATLSIPVKSYTNSCFTKLYPDFTNLVADPYVSKLSNFTGWGTRSINTNPAFVFCGATSGKVSGTNAGSLDISLTGKLLTNTTYRVKAKVYAVGGSFQMGVFGWSNGQGDYTKSITQTGSWQNVDFTITTGAALGTTQGLFFNNYGLAGTSGYIDNWEMYAVPKTYTSLAALDFTTPGSKTVTVRGVNLTQDIVIAAPTGFTVSPSSMAANVNGGVLTVSFNGPASTTGYVYFTSGTVKDSLKVTGSADPTIVSTSTAITVDEINTGSSFRVTGYNLTSDITLSAPEGITLSASTLPSTAIGTTVTLTYDGKANSSGNITLTSGTATTSIKLTAQRNEDCFTPLYPSGNLIVDPTCNYYTTDGWGTRSINTDAAFVYCGSRSGKVTNSGSLDRNLTGVLKPNTTYRLKAKVYKESPVKAGNMGHVTYTLNMDSNSLPDQYKLIKTAMDSACAYYSKYTPFIENIYVYYSAGIPTAQASYHGSIGFGSNTRYMWVGTAIHEMAHYFGSGTTTEWQSHIVGGKWTGAIANALMTSINGGTISGDSQHFWPYGINQKEEITGLGSLAVQDKALADAVKVVKAMVVDDSGLPTNNVAVGVGVYGWDVSLADIYHEVTVANTWQDVDFTFTTGATLKASHGVFFNSGTGYIDNWELYEVPIASSVTNTANNQNLSAYIANNQLVAEFELAQAADVTLSLLDIQGKLLKQKTVAGSAGSNQQVIDLSVPKGIYIVRLVTGKTAATIKVTF
jgi:hypothetical protein